jgi:putative thioredoxin
MPHASPWIVDVVQASFEQDVIARSHELPVVVDFWAEWCPPCRALAPVLEKLAVEYDGQFLLAKAKAEDVQDAAMAFGVSSIPAVFALKGGKIVDQFVGVLPELRLRTWLDALRPSQAERLVAEAKALTETDPAAAEAKLREALAADPGDARIKISLAQLLLACGKLSDARGLIDALAERGFLEPEAERVRAGLALQGASLAAGDLEALRVRVANSPTDRALQLELAKALAASGCHDEALDHCLELVRQDRKGTGEAARQTMIDIFQVLGGDDERTSAYRRRLSAALY